MSVLYIVHCVDTEGPLTETLEATFARLSAAFGVDLPASKESLFKIQNRLIDLNGKENAIARMLAPNLLSYNNSWNMIDAMLSDCLSTAFRRQLIDDFDNGWVYSWHCMDHMCYPKNPRHKDVGYGNVFRHYRNVLREKHSSDDEVNWHFHPASIINDPLQPATSFTNSYRMLNEIICRRILEDHWFPTVNRPGFHAERPDSHAFLEQWIPFDYANQAYEEDIDQPDLEGGRYGDWRRAPFTWGGYQPHHDDYQRPGCCRRTIFRCLNVGTRFRELKYDHVMQAFQESRSKGAAILAFTNHDYRDIRPDVAFVRKLLLQVRGLFPDVKIRFSGAEAAARGILAMSDVQSPKLSIEIVGDRLLVESIGGPLFGPQPFLALMTRDGRVYHDNLDIQEPSLRWTYVLDAMTLKPAALARVGVGSAGRYGGYSVATLDLSDSR